MKEDGVALETSNRYFHTQGGTVNQSHQTGKILDHVTVHTNIQRHTKKTRAQSYTLAHKNTYRYTHTRKHTQTRARTNTHPHTHIRTHTSSRYMERRSGWGSLPARFIPSWNKMSYRARHAGLRRYLRTHTPQHTAIRIGAAMGLQCLQLKYRFSNLQNIETNNVLDNNVSKLRETKPGPRCHGRRCRWRMTVGRGATIRVPHLSRSSNIEGVTRFCIQKIYIYSSASVSRAKITSLGQILI